MRNFLGTVLPLLCLLNTAHARADETAAKSRIVAVGLFKNGLAVIKREVTLGKAGTYVLDDVPEPVHGTYWIESVAPVESSVEMREVEVPVNELAPGNLQEDLAGKKVTIHFKGDKATPTNGTVAKLKTLKSETARSRERILRYGNNSSVQPARFLVVQTAKGRSYIETSEIAYVESEGMEEKIMLRMPRLLLTVSETDKADSKVFVNYLTRGLSWAPSYRVDITDPKTLAVEQYAVVKNELADLDGTETMLISGFPSVQFAHVTSPLASRTSLAQFFQELNERGSSGADVVSQQRVATSNSPSMLALSMVATPTGEGVDLHAPASGSTPARKPCCMSTKPSASAPVLSNMKSRRKTEVTAGISSGSAVGNFVVARSKVSYRAPIIAMKRSTSSFVAASQANCYAPTGSRNPPSAKKVCTR